MIDVVIGTLITLILILGMIFEVKNTATFINHDKIMNAIYSYVMQCLDKDEEPLVSYEDMEPYDSTLYRLWDWGYKHILPPEKFEIIKPFIKNKKGK